METCWLVCESNTSTNEDDKYWVNGKSDDNKWNIGFIINYYSYVFNEITLKMCA
jgi:hypothetical protein